MRSVIQPDGWPRPRGYAHAVVAEGRLVFLAGQIGWDASETFRSDDFVEQARQALENVVTLLRAAGGRPEHLVRMTWYVVDKREYLGRLKELGRIYREVVGPTFPAMTAVEVGALIEARARLEIECTAVIPGCAAGPGAG